MHEFIKGTPTILGENKQSGSLVIWKDGFGVDLAQR